MPYSQHLKGIKKEADYPHFLTQIKLNSFSPTTTASFIDLEKVD